MPKIPPELPYPEVEDCVLPRDQIQQIEDELRMHPTSESFVRSLAELKEIYQHTPFMLSMRQFAEYAASFQSGADTFTHDTNISFYLGSLFGFHVNTWPAPAHIKRLVANGDYRHGIETATNRATIEENITAWLQEWTDGDNNWLEFMEEQSPRFLDAATECAALVHDELEQQLDFMVGFATATNLVWQLAKPKTIIDPPV